MALVGVYGSEDRAFRVEVHRESGRGEFFRIYHRTRCVADVLRGVEDLERRLREESRGAVGVADLIED